MNNNVDSLESEYIWRLHKPQLMDQQTSSVLVKRIRAPVNVVWSIVRRFDQPQRYKLFLQSCTVREEVGVGSIREVCVVSGLPATSSTERLEILDDTQHIFSYSVLGGDHRLKNYCSKITLQPEILDGNPGTLAIESYVVDVPEGNTKEDTKVFVEAVIKCNLKSLADVSEKLATQGAVDPIETLDV